MTGWARRVGLAIRLDGVATRVVPGCDGVTFIQMARAPEQRAELDIGIAVHAGRRRLATEICIQERLQHASVELALQVHDIERDTKLRCDSPGIVRCVQRAAALLELRIGVGHVVQPHPYAHDVVPLLVQERGRNRRIHASGHGHQGASHPAILAARRDVVRPRRPGRAGPRLRPRTRDASTPTPGARPRRPHRSRHRSWSARGRVGGRHGLPPPGSPWQSGRG